MDAPKNILHAARHVSELAKDEVPPLPFKPISADSHVTEPPNCYRDYIDPAFRDRAPYVAEGPNGGEFYVIEGMADGQPYRVTYGGASAAGVDPKLMRMDTVKFAEIHRGGWDGKARVADQDRDGLGGEVIYPSVGMAICNHPDAAFKQACFTAYNRWLEEFVSAAPDRLFGLGQTAVTSVEQAVADLEAIKASGFVGAMFPCEPATDFEYDDPAFDPVWEAATSLKLPVVFHILTSRRNAPKVRVDSPDAKGRSMAHFHHTLIRANQDVISSFIWGRVFERHPALKLVCAEADAGWAPHFMYRLDHFYHRHRYHQKVPDMARLPSEQFADNVYITFQDDVVALNCLNMLNPRRLLWANDFPHSDSTWPWSRQLLARQTAHLSEDQRRWILRDNTVEAFNLPVG
jgi:predicted TIM-barrel fold metal-dependent hydrolase